MYRRRRRWDEMSLRSSRHFCYKGNIVPESAFQSLSCQVEQTCLTYLSGLLLWLRAPLVYVHVKETTTCHDTYTPAHTGTCIHTLWR